MGGVEWWAPDAAEPDLVTRYGNEPTTGRPAHSIGEWYPEPKLTVDSIP